MTSIFFDRWGFKATAGALAVLVAASTLGEFGCASRKQYAINEAILISERRQLEDEIYRMQFELRDALAENERLQAELDGGAQTPKARNDSSRSTVSKRNSASTVDATRYPGGDSLRVATPVVPKLAQTKTAPPTASNVPTGPTEIVDEPEPELSLGPDVAGAPGATGEAEPELYFPNAGYRDVKLQAPNGGGANEYDADVGAPAEGEIEQLPDFVPIPVSVNGRGAGATLTGTPENVATTQVGRTTQNNRTAGTNVSGKMPGARRSISTQTAQRSKSVKSTKVVAASASEKADVKRGAGVEQTSYQRSSKQTTTATERKPSTSKRASTPTDGASDWSPLSN